MGGEGAGEGKERSGEARSGGLARGFTGGWEPRGEGVIRRGQRGRCQGALRRDGSVLLESQEDGGPEGEEWKLVGGGGGEGRGHEREDWGSEEGAVLGAAAGLWPESAAGRGSCRPQACSPTPGEQEPFLKSQPAPQAGGAICLGSLGWGMSPWTFEGPSEAKLALGGAAVFFTLNPHLSPG